MKSVPYSEMSIGVPKELTALERRHFVKEAMIDVWRPARDILVCEVVEGSKPENRDFPIVSVKFGRSRRPKTMIVLRWLLHFADLGPLDRMLVDTNIY